MEQRRGLCLVLSVALLGQAFAVPLEAARLRRGYAVNEVDLKERHLNNLEENGDLEAAGSERRPARQDNPNNADSKEDDTKPAESATTTAKTELATPVYNDDDSDEDDDFDPAPAPAGGGGSNIFSLLRLANAFFPSSSGANSVMRNIIRRYLTSQVFPTAPFFPAGLDNGLNLNPTIQRRQDVSENLVDIDEIQGLKPPPQFQRQETQEDDDSGDENSADESDGSDENNAAEESIEDKGNGGNENDNSNASRPKSEESNGKGGDDNGSDYSDEPEGDGQGGGVLGILASLSGGEDGQSDLGSLLATVSGIVANLSGGEGFDLNAIIASGIGLFVGLLSEGEENPGAVIASYLLTSLDTVTGGGSKNNGAFFGTFLSKLLRGSSAGGDPDASSEEGKEPEKDSAGFFSSFLMALLGEMSKGSSGGSSSSSSSHHPAAEQQWR